MSSEPIPAEIAIEPPFVAAGQFEEFVAFLVALGYQVVTVHSRADGFGGEVVVPTDSLFCPSWAVAISLAPFLDEGKCVPGAARKTVPVPLGKSPFGA